jgi:hypothetical protein
MRLQLQARVRFCHREKNVRKWQWMLLVICLFSPDTVQGQQRPLTIDDAEILKTGRVRAQFGIEFLQRQRYSLSGLEGDLIRFGVSSIHVGVGEYAEFQISGVLQDVLSISERSEPIIPPDLDGNSTSDFGDLVLASKIKLLGEKGLRPAMAFKFAVQLPNASLSSGLGTDETQFYSSLLFKKNIGRAQISADLGFAILSSPVPSERQTDPLAYGVASIVRINRHINLAAEITGRHGPSENLANKNTSQVRAGLQFWTGSIRWDVGGIAGLKRFDPKSGIVVGVTYEFQAFKKNGPAFKIRH